MVCGSRRIELHRIASQGLEEEGIPDAAQRDHIDRAPEDLREILAQAHVCAEQILRVIGKIDEHIDVAALGVEVIARGRTDQFKKRNTAPRAGGPNTVEVVGYEADHADRLPRCVRDRNLELTLHWTDRRPHVEVARKPVGQRHRPLAQPAGRACLQHPQDAPDQLLAIAAARLPKGDKKSEPP